MPTEFWIFNFGLSTLIGAAIGLYFGLVKKWPQHPAWIIATILYYWLAYWTGSDFRSACIFCTTIDGVNVGIGLKGLGSGFLLTVSVLYLLVSRRRNAAPEPADLTAEAAK